MGKQGPVFDDERTAPPAVPVYDEEHPEHVPGSFMSALPQFFVFPLILVGTLLAIWIGLRWVAVGEPATAGALLTDMRASGPHSRWQVAQQLAEGLQRGRLTLDDVPAAELASLYESMVPRVEPGASQSVREQAQLMRQYMLSVLATKGDPALTRYAIEALDHESREVRMSGLVALGQMADPAATPALARHLDSDASEERWLAIGALALVGTPEALDRLTRLLGGNDSLDHRNAVLALAARGDARAGPYLLPMLSRDSYGADPALDPPDADLLDAPSRAESRRRTIDSFLENSARAAVQLGDPAAVPGLRKLRRDDPSLKVQSAAISALHDLGANTETDDGDV